MKLADGAAMRKSRMLDFVDSMKVGKTYSLDNMIVICQRLTGMTENSCRRLIRDMCRIDYIKVNTEGRFERA